MAGRVVVAGVAAAAAAVDGTVAAGAGVGSPTHLLCLLCLLPLVPCFEDLRASTDDVMMTI